ncbi:SDR family oxidoreductase [Anaerorhabdus sp.]|jgi:short-subunit dehydrogenase|uniref:SDR family oxidoreductase n=1 Tax=Anaerorhabdus sp. TaxID=1872524 RepID=UPI002FC699F5
MKKTVCITGATDGLGKALVYEFINRNDYQLILCGRSEEKMKDLLATIPSNNILYSECFDLLNDDQINTFTNNVLNQCSSIDILINNAGANYKKAPVESLDINDLRNMFQLNCISHLQLIQAFYPSMKKQGTGHILNVLSSCCLFNNENMAGYTASKDAMNAISKTLTKEARNDHIKITSVYPGGIDTNFRAIPNHSYLKPESVAKAIVDCIELPEDAVMHDLVLRPFSESNF